MAKWIDEQGNEHEDELTPIGKGWAKTEGQPYSYITEGGEIRQSDIQPALVSPQPKSSWVPRREFYYDPKATPEQNVQKSPYFQDWWQDNPALLELNIKEQVAKIREEQEAGAFFLYGIAKKHAELLATEMPLPAGGKITVPDPVVLQLAAEGYRTNKMNIEQWYNGAINQFDIINRKDELSGIEKRLAKKQALGTIYDNRPIIIPQSATIPSLQNIRQPAEMPSADKITTPEENKEIDIAVQTGDLGKAAAIQTFAKKRFEKEQPLKQLETEVNTAIQNRDFITAYTKQKELNEKKRKVQQQITEAKLPRQKETSFMGLWPTIPKTKYETPQTIPTIITKKDYDLLPNGLEYYDQSGRKARKQ